MPLVYDIEDVGQIDLDPTSARRDMYADCSAEVAEKAVALLRAEPAAIFAMSPTRAVWKEVHTTCVSGNHDRAILAAMTDHFAERSNETDPVGRQSLAVPESTG